MFIGDTEVNDCIAVTISATARAILGVYLGLLLSVSVVRAADELILEGERVSVMAESLLLQ